MAFNAQLMPFSALRHAICSLLNTRDPTSQDKMGTQITFGASCSVAKQRKKIVAFLVAALLCSGTLALVHAQSTAPEPKKPLINNSDSLFTKDPNLHTKPTNSLDTHELFFKMMLAILLVIVLGAAAIYVSKKVLPKITNLPSKEIRIVETVHLGPRKAVHLLKIRDQLLLIGSTGENITKLADLTYGFSKTDLPPQKTDNVREFL